MKEPERGTPTTLARFLSGLRNLPQSTKILLVALLLVGGVALWYVGLYLPAQGGPAAAEPSQAAPTPGPIEAPPIPPLTPSEEAKTEPQTQTQAPQAEPPKAEEPPRTVAPPRAVQATTPPPNPFVPLVVEAPAPPIQPQPVSPIPRGEPVVVAPPPRVEVRPQAPLPTPTTGRTPLPGTAGALPAPKVLTPTARVETPALPQERVAPQAPLTLVEAPLPQEAGPSAQEGVPPTPTPAPKTPLEALVEEKGLKLSGTLLGPVSVAILESKDGYLVLPAGSPIPGSEAIVKGIEEGRVTLALKEERMDLTLSGGGE